MGAESSVLQGCKLEEPLEIPSQNEWRLHPAKRKDGSRVSVFVHKKSEQEDRRLENAAKQLKILRHPTILKFFASCDNVEGTYLITEQVRPLELVLDSLNPEEICAGLYNIAEALSFLHERGGASHNNVCLSSVYVSCQDGGWRLGGMEHLCKFEDATAQFLKACRAMRNADAIPLEEEEDSKTSNSPQYGHARDAYAFGVLAQNMLEYLTDLGSMSANFERQINDEFLHSNPMLRPKLSTLLNDQLFKNDFLEITNFLVHLTLKPEAAKNTFFEGLAPRLNCLPRQLVANRLAPLLLSSFVLAEPMAVTTVLPHFMTPLRESNAKQRPFLTGQLNPLFPEDLFKECIIPIIKRLFPSREMHVRICLLEFFPCYVDLFEADVLKRGILPQLLVGLRDSHDELVAASLRALAGTVPILGSDVVVGGERIKYFVEGRPNFFSKKESPLKKMVNATNLTAVSGVITLPLLDKTPPTKKTPPAGDRRMSEDEDEDVIVARRQKERERRREEMRIKNEQRRKEKEARKEKESRKFTLLSLTGMSKDSVESIGDNHSKQTSERNTPSFDSVEMLKEPEVTPDYLSLHKNEDDWSDWDDVSQPASTASTELDQSGILLHDTNPNCHQELVVTGKGKEDTSYIQSDLSKETDDWSKVDSNWTNERGHAAIKKSTKSLQLKKSSSKVSPNEQKPDTRKLQTQPTSEEGSSKRPATPARTKQKVNTELGSEFAIPDIVSPKGRSLEVDFFADMVPSLSFTSKTLSETEKANGAKVGVKELADEKASQKPEETSRSSPMHFQMTRTSVASDTGEGWGIDDFTWEEMES